MSEVASQDNVSVGVDLHARPRWSDLDLTYLIERGGLNLDRTAVVFEDRSRTYGELRDRSRRIGNALIGLGVRPLERVALVASNCLEYLEIELGIAAAGAVMVALGWRLSPPELRNLLARSHSRVALVEERFLETINGLRVAGDLPNLKTVISVGGTAADLCYEDFCSAASAHRPDVRSSLTDPHEIIYTSGTTGDPKGAVWTHGTVIWNSIEQVMDYGIAPHHANYVLNDLHYIGGRHDFTWPMIHQGATVHVRRAGGFDAESIMRYVEEHRITHILWVPTMLYEILRVPNVGRFDTTCLEMIMCGGQPIPVSVISDVQRLFPRTNFVQVFGLTEGGGTVTFVPREYATKKIGSAGRPSMHNEIRIVDEHGRDCLPDESGEILVKGPTVVAGYWDAREATERSIVDGWLHTGDLGYLDEDGFLFVSGRKKDMIISGGMNIYPSEVESVLMQHPAVSGVSVIGVPDEKWGERVCAVVVLEEGSVVEPEELVEYCRERLASYKKPTIVKFLDDFPMTTSGKVQKFRLRELFIDSAKDTL